MVQCSSAYFCLLGGQICLPISAIIGILKFMAHIVKHVEIWKFPALPILFLVIPTPPAPRKEDAALREGYRGR